jgi:putative FmdB family regulatory protein
MPFYDFKCDKCEKIVEEFFKIADNKYIECCGIQMEQVVLKVPGGNKPRERVVQTKGGYYMEDVKSGSLRKVGPPPKVGK